MRRSFVFAAMGLPVGSWLERAGSLVAVGGLAVSAAAAPEAPEGPAEQTSDAGLIRISDGGLHPAVFRAAPDEDVAWSNQDVHLAVVSFSDDLAGALSCGDEEVRPTFHADGRGRLISDPIRSLPFALPCPLPPGTHGYRVHLLHQGAPPGSLIASPAPIDDADETLEGTLIVEESERGEDASD